MPFVELSKNIFDCSMCEHRCDAVSKAVYEFDDDILFSNLIQDLVIELIRRINISFDAFRNETDHSHPDLIIKRKNSIEEVALIEIKVQARTFMKIRELLPASNLYPSETLTLNLSDLERYYSIKEKLQKPIYIVWCLINRACLTGINFRSIKFYHQELDVLKKIHSNDIDNSRRFRRKSGKGDVDQMGEHKGVVVNYHFSINEMNEGLPLIN